MSESNSICDCLPAQDSPTPLRNRRGHQWINRGTPSENGRYLVKCACGWSAVAKGKRGARSAYHQHRTTVPWRCRCGEANPERRAENKSTALCKTCITNRAKRFALKEHGRWVRQKRDSHFRRKFGITVVEYDRLLAAQGGGCAICGKLQAESEKTFHVDHDHATGKVRGILCGGCNFMLGQVRDDPAILRTAIAYLQASPCQNAPERF